MKTAIYMRCSTDHQDTESQRHALNEWVAKSDAEDLRWYDDTGVSGAAVKRPEWDRLMADARAGEVDRIVVFKKDRIGRDFANRLSITAELMGLGVKVVSLHEQIDTDSLEGLLMECVSAYVAASERRNIIDRTRAGIARVKGTGGKWDQSRAARRVFDHDEARRLHQQGVSRAELARRYGVSWPTIDRVINAA